MKQIFSLEATDGPARAGTLHTPHGDVPTPAFMPVATQGSVKALDTDDLESIGAAIVLANTYHLYLRPGVEIIERLGGLHGFMSWEGPILTDSGGFQGFSLEHLRDITDDAIVFRSHIDGSEHVFTPEAVMAHQERLGADVIMPLDVCPPADSDLATVERSVETTRRWAEQSRSAHRRDDQALFGIVQGGMFPEMRERSAAGLVAMDFPGYSIGGLSVGETKDQMSDMTESTARLLPADKPRYLMGVGSPEDLVESVARGIDMFDCVLPTRIARNGALLVGTGRVNVDKGGYREREGPIEEGCDCYTCTHYSAAYVHHLFRAKELLAYRLATIHNLRFTLRLMVQIREAIVQGRFARYRERFWERFTPPGESTRREQKSMWLASRARAREATD